MSYVDRSDRIRQSNIRVHNLEADLYDAIHPELFGSLEQEKFARDIDVITSATISDSQLRILDIGCGTGNLTLKFLERGHQVRAFDISPGMIGKLRAKLSMFDPCCVELVIDDAENVLIDARTYGTWDIVAFSSVLHHLPDYRMALIHALHQLRPGGILYVCHEPLRRTNGKRDLVPCFASGILDGVDNLYIYTLKLLANLSQSLRTRRLPRRIDYGWSDYHARTGIDAEGILQELELAGGKTLLHETYRARYWDALAMLDTRFEVSRPSHFRFILQSTGKSDP